MILITYIYLQVLHIDEIIESLHDPLLHQVEVISGTKLLNVALVYKAWYCS